MRKIRVSYTGFEPLYVERPEVSTVFDAEALCQNPEAGILVLVRKAADIELQQELRTFLKEAEPKDHGFDPEDLDLDEWRAYLGTSIQNQADSWQFDETPKPRGGRRDKKVDVSSVITEGEDLETMTAAELVERMKAQGLVK